MADRVVNYVFKGSFTNLTAGLAASGKAVGDLGTKLTALDKEGAKKRAGLKAVGDTAGKIGLVAAAGFGAAVIAAASFDKAMSAVQAATHESTGNMEKLRAAAIKAGADTVFSASEAANGIEELAKAGVSTQDILGGGLSGALNLAAAGGLSVADAAETAATALTQFKLGGEDVNHVADLLAAGAGKAQGDVSDLGMALKQSGLVAQQTGLTIEETTGTLAAFASAGLIGSDAGTSFKTMLQALTPSGEKAQSAMDSLGITAYDASGKFVGMTQFAGSLRNALKGLSAEQQNAALKTIFGSDAVRAASVIYQQGAGGIESWINKVNDSGYAAKTAAIRMDNLSGDLEQFKGSLETALIGAGEGSQGPLRKLVQGATDAVNAFNKMPPAAKNVTAGLLGITAVTGGAVWLGATVVAKIAATSTALEALGIKSATTKGALLGVGKAAGVAAIGIGGLMLLDGVVNSTDKTAEGVNTLTASLLDLADAGARSRLPQDLDGIKGSIDRLLNPTWGYSSDDWLRNKLPLLGDNKSLKEAKIDIGALDGALAGLVASAGPSGASSAFNDMAQSMHLSSSEQTKLKDLLPQYKDALAGASNSTRDLAGATGATGAASSKAAQRIAALNKAIEVSRKDARSTADSFVAFGSSLSNTKVSLGQWIASMRKQAAALRDFRVNAQRAARQGLDDGLIASLEKAGPAGALRMKQLANATKSQIAAANGAWRSGQREVNRYTDAIGGVPKSVNTNVNLNTGSAMRELNAVEYALARLHDKTVTIHTVMMTSNLSKLAGVPMPGAADGTTVPKTGKPYADRHLYLLADGEEVISNRRGQADQFRSDRAAGRIPAYGDGGTARHAADAYHNRSASGASSERVVIERVVERFADRVTLVDRDGAIGEFVVRKSRSEVDADRSYRNTLSRQGVNY